MNLREVPRLRTRHLLAAKRDGERLTSLTTYDALSAQIFDQAGIDVLLVGDSAANTVFGRSSTLSITLDEIILLARAVTASVKRSFVVVDMTFGSYEVSDDTAVANAVRVMRETGADAVKIEGDRPETIRRIVDAGIPVVAHLGFTPQSEHALGGYVVQGRGDGAEALERSAHSIADSGATAVVLEMVPRELAAKITQAINIPTIGIGAGAGTDGQVLVWQDAFGLTQKAPSFVRRFAELGEQLTQAATEYRAAVADGSFPAEDESFT